MPIIAPSVTTAKRSANAHAATKSLEAAIDHPSTVRVALDLTVDQLDTLLSMIESHDYPLKLRTRGLSEAREWLQFLTTGTVSDFAGDVAAMLPVYLKLLAVIPPKRNEAGLSLLDRESSLAYRHIAEAFDTLQECEQMGLQAWAASQHASPECTACTDTASRPHGSRKQEEVA